MDRYNGKKVRHAFLGMDVPIVDDIGDAIGDAADWTWNAAKDAGEWTYNAGKDAVNWGADSYDDWMHSGWGWLFPVGKIHTELNEAGVPFAMSPKAQLTLGVGSAVGGVAGNSAAGSAASKAVSGATSGSGGSKSSGGSGSDSSNFGRSALLDQIIAQEVARDPLDRGHERESFAEGGAVDPIYVPSSLIAQILATEANRDPLDRSSERSAYATGGAVRPAPPRDGSTTPTGGGTQPTSSNSGLFGLTVQPASLFTPNFQNVISDAQNRYRDLDQSRVEFANALRQRMGQPGIDFRNVYNLLGGSPTSTPPAFASLPPVRYTPSVGPAWLSKTPSGPPSSPGTIQPPVTPRTAGAAGLPDSMKDPVFIDPRTPLPPRTAPPAAPAPAPISGGRWVNDSSEWLPSGGGRWVNDSSEWLPYAEGGEIPYFADGGTPDLQPAGPSMSTGFSPAPALQPAGPSMSTGFSPTPALQRAPTQSTGFSQTPQLQQVQQAGTAPPMSTGYSPAGGLADLSQANALTNMGGGAAQAAMGWQGPNLSGANNALGAMAGYGSALGSSTGPDFGAANNTMGGMGQTAGALTGYGGPNFGQANTALGTMGNTAGALGGFSGPNFSAANTTLGQNQGLINDVMGAARGQGPSVAEELLRQQTNQNVSQIGGLISSQKGINPAMAGRLAAQQGGQMQQQAAGQGSLLRAQEIGQNRSLAGNLLAQQAGLQTQQAATTGAQQLQGMTAAGALQGQQAGMYGQNAAVSGAQQLAGLQAGGNLLGQMAGLQSQNAMYGNNAQQNALLGAANIYGNLGQTAGNLSMGASAQQLQGLLGGGTLANALSGTSGSQALGQGNLTLGQGNLYAQMAQADAANQLGWGQLGANYDLGMGQLSNQNLGSWLNALGQYNATNAQGQNVANLANAQLMQSLLGAGINSGGAILSKLPDILKGINGLGGSNATGLGNSGPYGYANSGVDDYNSGSGGSDGDGTGPYIDDPGDSGYYTPASGGQVPTFEEAIQEYGSPFHVPPFAAGSLVPGRAQFPGDTERNDHVPAMLSPGEVVIPRSVAMAPDAPERAARFVAAIRRKSFARA